MKIDEIHPEYDTGILIASACFGIWHGSVAAFLFAFIVLYLAGKALRKAGWL